MDMTNPQVAKQFEITPQFLEMVQDSPDMITKISRGMVPIVLRELYDEIIQNPEASVSQKLQFLDRLQSLADLKPKETTSAAGPGFSVVINIPGVESKSVVVDSTCTTVDE